MNLFSLQILFIIKSSCRFTSQEASCFSTGVDGGNVILDELDGTCGNLSVTPGTPEYHKVRTEMEQIHVS